MTLIEASGVTRAFGQGGGIVHALREVSIAVGAGAFVGVTGESGSGKSTLLAILGLMDSPTSGEVRFRGESVERLPARRLAALRLRHVGFVFQDFLLVRHLSALDNVRLPIDFAGEEGAARARELLARVGMEHRAGHRPDELSRGEMQRVAIARALANSPDVLLADEPTANLDRANADVVWKLLHDLHRDDGLTVIVATHDRARLADVSERLVLSDGRAVRET